MYPMARARPIIVGELNVDGIANIREIVYDINQSIDQVQNAGDERIAGILKELGMVFVRDPRLQKRVRRAIIESLRTITREAALAPAERRLRVVELSLRYISILLIANRDILHHFEAHLEDLRKFFGIPG